MKEYLTEYIKDGKVMCGVIKADTWEDAERMCLREDERVIGEAIITGYYSEN